MFKQLIVVRKDLKLPPGKLAVQVAHASVGNVLQTKKKIIESWQNNGAKKVVLRVNDEESLIRFHFCLRAYNPFLVCDAGKTVVPKGTITCFALLCKDKDKEINNLKLKLY